MHWRIDVTEVPLEGRQLTIGMHVPLPRHQEQLTLREGCIHQGKWNTVERQVPSRIPREFPFVWHGNDVLVQHMVPIAVADPSSLVCWLGTLWVAFKEPVDIVVVELLAPYHSSQGLPLNPSVLRVGNISLQDAIELVCLLLPCIQCCLEVHKRVAARLGHDTHPHSGATAGRDAALHPEAGLGSMLCAGGRSIALDDVGMEGVLVGASTSAPTSMVELRFSVSTLRLSGLCNW
mmetsp:Transcript_67586/g.156891  ORF Transcript_67586/g.156891 Transcript_67586/m.156891 type:complete len:234 (-) Transcript_67586:53-754(-)